MALIEIDVDQKGRGNSRWSIKIRPNGEKVEYEVDNLQSFKKVLQWLSSWMYGHAIDLTTPKNVDPLMWSSKRPEKKVKTN